MNKNLASGLFTLTLLLAIAAMPAASQTFATPAIAHNTWSSGAPMPIAVWCPMMVKRL